MKRHGLLYLQTGHIPTKADTAKQQQWLKEKLEPATKEAQKGECHLLFMDFLKQLKEYYGDMALKIVLDNARYQHCKLVEDAAKQLNITLLFYLLIHRT